MAVIIIGIAVCPADVYPIPIRLLIISVNTNGNKALFFHDMPALSDVADATAVSIFSISSHVKSDIFVNSANVSKCVDLTPYVAFLIMLNMNM